MKDIPAELRGSKETTHKLGEKSADHLFNRDLCPEYMKNLPPN
jgi:hypothetical protein